MLGRRQEELRPLTPMLELPSYGRCGSPAGPNDVPLTEGWSLHMDAPMLVRACSCF